MDLRTDVDVKTLKLEAGELADVFISREMFNNEVLYEIAMKELKENKEILKDKTFEDKLMDWPQLLYKIIISTNY